MDIRTEDDVCERFSVFQSLRSESDARAIHMKASENNIDAVNRWKSVEGGMERVGEERLGNTMQKSQYYFSLY